MSCGLLFIYFNFLQLSYIYYAYNTIMQGFAYIMQVSFPFLHVQEKRTPLMGASLHGHAEVVRLLIKAKAQLNQQDKVLLTGSVL